MSPFAPSFFRFFSFRRFPARDLLAFAVFAGLCAWLLVESSGTLGYNWQWYQVPRYIYRIVDGEFIPGPLLQGLAVTFRITGISLVLAFLFGLVAAFLRLSGSLLGQGLARLYLEVVRNTPLLVQLFFIYFVLAPVIGLDRFTSAVLALSLFEGAYASEIFRAGIVSIHQGQWEAAYSLGMNTPQTYRHIVLPQAIRRVVPPLTSQAISLIKDSALVSTLSLFDLTMQGQTIIAETYLTFEIWFTVAAIYLMITIPLSLGVNLLERILRGGA
jgi:polar amino acid transport system permease protein